MSAICIRVEHAPGLPGYFPVSKVTCDNCGEPCWLSRAHGDHVVLCIECAPANRNDEPCMSYNGSITVEMERLRLIEQGKA